MDLDFIAGNFLHGDLPIGKEYLQHYFKGEAERSFLSYYYLFSSLYKEGEDFQCFYLNFSDHTGISCTSRWVRKLLTRLKNIENTLTRAESSFDLAHVGQIKSGKASF